MWIYFFKHLLGYYSTRTFLLKSAIHVLDFFSGKTSLSNQFFYWSRLVSQNGLWTLLVLIFFKKKRNLIFNYFRKKNLKWVHWIYSTKNLKNFFIIRLILILRKIPPFLGKLLLIAEIFRLFLELVIGIQNGKAEFWSFFLDLKWKIHNLNPG